MVRATSARGHGLEKSRLASVDSGAQQQQHWHLRWDVQDRGRIAIRVTEEGPPNLQTSCEVPPNVL